MRKSTLLIVFSMFVGIAILLALGTWQVKRLAWKEELISRTLQRSNTDPLGIAEVETIWKNSADVDYVSIMVEGEFEHAHEMYYYNTWNGRAGWNVITPLRLADERILLLNRGFVPLDKRDPQLRTDGQVSGPIKIIGLARNPVRIKPNSLMPDNIPEKREFFWKDFKNMAALGPDGAAKLPFFVDAGTNTGNYEFPMGGTTRINFPNNHLQYAATWYGLALALLVVGSVFLYGRRTA